MKKKKDTSGRMLILHSPNHMIERPKIVFDSKRKKFKNKRFEDVYMEHYNVGDDPETSGFFTLVDGFISTREILKFVRHVHPIVGPIDLEHHNINTICRQFVEEVFGKHHEPTFNIHSLISEYHTRLKSTIRLTSRTSSRLLKKK